MILIAQLIFIASIGGVLLIILRKVPYLAQLPEDSFGGRPSPIARLADKIIPERAQPYFERTGQVVWFILKFFLKRIKIYLLRLGEWSWPIAGSCLRKIRMGFSDIFLKIREVLSPFVAHLLGNENKFSFRSLISQIKEWLIRIKAGQEEKKRKKRFRREERKNIRAILKDPKDIEAYKNLSILYFEQENYRDARASLIRYTKIGGKDEGLKELLAEVRRRIGQKKTKPT